MRTRHARIARDDGKILANSWRVLKYFGRVEMVQSPGCNIAAPGLCWRGLGVGSGTAGKRECRHRLGRNTFGSQLLAGGISPTAQTNVALRCRPRTDTCDLDLAVRRKGEEIQR